MPIRNAWFIVAGLFALIACIVSLISIAKHFLNYKRPDLQRLIVRILVMPLIYAICSWLSLGYDWAVNYLTPIRDCYEAFVLWMFFQLLINYMDGESSLLHKLDDGRLPIPHTFPIRLCLGPVDFSEPHNFILLKRAILQFVIVKPIQTIIVGLLRVVDYYNDGVLSRHNGFLYVNLIYNLSVMICMYGLVMFYLATRYDLSERKPMAKFLCIKSVIFFSFWQSLVIAILSKVGAIPAEIPSPAVQDFLTCFEMMLASFAHIYAFGHQEYADLDSARLPWPYAIRDAFSFKDLQMEIRHTWRGTYFRGYNDILAGHGNNSSEPLLAGGTSASQQNGSYLQLNTKLEFDDIHSDDADENLYEAARNIGGEYNYRVISPNIRSPHHYEAASESE